MSVGDTYVLTARYAHLGQQCLNVYYYQNLVADGDPEDLAVAFDSNVHPSLAAVQSNGVTGVDIYVYNQEDDAEFGTFPIVAYIGAVTGDALPTFAAWGFIYFRTLRSTHNGAKRFPGVPESLQISGVATAGALTLLNSLATDLGATLVGASGANYQPVIYHAPTAEHPIETRQAVSSVAYRRITTQNTRKIGRGS